MAKPLDSKDKTLAAAAALFRRHGYHATTLNDILEAGGAPRGSLYFHFPKGKEQIGEAAIKLASDRVRDALAAAADSSDTAEAFLTRLARSMAADLEKSGYTEGCPIATTALETAAHSDVLGAAIRTAFENWEAVIKAKFENFGMKSADVGVLATMALSQLEGALLLSRTYRSIEPMRRAEKALKLLLQSRQLK